MCSYTVYAFEFLVTCSQSFCTVNKVIIDKLLLGVTVCCVAKIIVCGEIWLLDITVVI